MCAHITFLRSTTTEQREQRKINVQIALNQGTVHIGSPLLLGSY